MALNSLHHYPRHIAIIMDGNGRWAESRGYPRTYGHVRGTRRVREVIQWCIDAGISALTLYAFSNENWGRPSHEINTLMLLLKKWLLRERIAMMKKNIRFQVIGERARLPLEVQKIIRELEQLSESNTGLQLQLALSYSSRAELAQIAQTLAEQVLHGQLKPTDIDEKLVSSHCSTALVGDPDLLIRTSGEVRLSNFLLWQMAYTEMYFTPTLWPDFTKRDFEGALQAFASRNRRFGLTQTQQKLLDAAEGSC